MKLNSAKNVSVTIDQYATAVLHFHGVVQATTYQTIIDTAKELLAEGHTNLVIDLTNVPRLNLTTLFTLYSLVLIASKQQPASLEGGWNALHEMENAVMGQPEPVANLNLCVPQPKVAQALRQGGLTDVVAMWATLSMALKAFSPPLPATPIHKPVRPMPAWQTAVPYHAVSSSSRPIAIR